MSEQGAPTSTVSNVADLPEEVRLARAIDGFVAEFGPKTTAWLDSCIRCGLCAEACHFHKVDPDPKYVPINKIVPFEKAWKRHVGPVGLVRRMLGLAPRVTFEELREWEELIYDSCTMCGRCTLVCPMGIDIAELVHEARHGLFEAGLVPSRLKELDEKAHRLGSPFGTAEEMRAQVERVVREYGIDIPLDRDRADVLVTVTPTELEEKHEVLAAMARIFNHLGWDWTLRSDAFEAHNFGYLSGDMETQGKLTTRLIDTAREIGAKMLVIPECGHAWQAARWETWRWYDEPLDLEIRHVVEVLGMAVEEGRLRFEPLGKSATFHDPCQQIRRGGLDRWPRVIMEALGLEVREMTPSHETAYCCGGGGGVVAILRARELRDKVFEMKAAQFEETGADLFLTSCDTCQLTFRRGAADTGWDRQVDTLLQIMARQLVSDQPPLERQAAG